MLWFRVDNRLVHGQVIEGWLPYAVQNQESYQLEYL